MNVKKRGRIGITLEMRGEAIHHCNSKLIFRAPKTPTNSHHGCPLTLSSIFYFSYINCSLQDSIAAQKRLDKMEMLMVETECFQTSKNVANGL